MSASQPETVTLDDPSAYFDRLDTFTALHWWPRVMRWIAVECLRREVVGRADLRAIDIGCGTGRLLPHLAALPEIGEAIGLEPEAAAIERGEPGFAIRPGSAVEIPLLDESVDVVTCFDVIQHLPAGSDRVALAEFERILRPDGILVLRANAGGKTGYRLGDLRRKVMAAGLKVSRSTYLNGLPALAQEVRGLWRGAGRAEGGHPEGRGLPLASAGGWESRLMGWIACVEAWAVVRLGLSLPWGHSTFVVARKAGPGSRASADRGAVPQ
jgi:SAM-dependent methyltransferase